MIELFEPGGVFNRVEMNKKIEGMMQATFLGESGLVDNAGEAIIIPSEQVSGLSGYLIGSYTGNGANGREISLGVRPKAVLLAGRVHANSQEYSAYLGTDIFQIEFASAGTFTRDANSSFSLTDVGFKARSDLSGAMNVSGTLYAYIVLYDKEATL